MSSLPIAMPVALPPLPPGAIAVASPEQTFAAMIQQLLSQIPAPPESEVVPVKPAEGTKQPIRFVEIPGKLPDREIAPPKERQIKPAIAVPVDVVLPPMPVIPVKEAPPEVVPAPKSPELPEVAAAPSVAKEPALVVAIQNTSAPVPVPIVEAHEKREPAVIAPFEKPRSLADDDGVKVPVLPPAAQPAAAVPNFQIQADATKPSNPTHQHAKDAPPAVMAPEPPPVEKPAAQPVRSVALEFTADGARDVRVRLAERAGEVHVSVHSADPTVTRELRDGVTELANVLAHAGYDARMWPSDRQEHGNQQPRDQRPPHRQHRHPEDPGNFDGALQEGIEEVSL